MEIHLKIQTDIGQQLTVGPVEDTHIEVIYPDIHFRNKEPHGPCTDHFGQHLFPSLLYAMLKRLLEICLR